MPQVKRFIPLSLLLLPLTACGSGGSSISTAPTPTSTQTYKLVWADEFNGAANSTPASTDWNFETGNGPSGNQEIEWYCPPGNNTSPCSTANPNLYEDGQGHLVINATKTANGWTSARLNTQDKHTWTYGRVEARIKLPVGAGFWPAFWLLGNNISTVSWPQCGEQDIIEWVQKYGPTTTSSTVHGPGYSGAGGITAQFTFPSGGRIDDAAFHTYGMTWSPNKMEFYRDDPTQPYFTVTPSNLPAGAAWVFDKPFFIVLNFAIGNGGFAGVTDSTTPASGQMLVDYVHVYQLQ